MFPTFPLMLSHSRHAALTESLARRGRPAASSRHFAVYPLDPPAESAASAETVVVHRFAPSQIDNNLGYYVVSELLPLLAARLGAGDAADERFAYTEQEVFEHCVGAIVRSIDANERRAWHRFYANTLAALERAIADPAQPADFIGPFGVIYDRVAQLACGRTLLDAGTCFGFLPLLLPRRSRGHDGAHADAERPPQIVGCDQEAALIGFARAYAAHQGIDHVRFVVADILADDIERLGVFDTVTAIHLLEHLDPRQTRRAIANLWRLTGKRLIINVPLEETPDPRFGHRQVFDQERLIALGQELGGPFQYFELHGGWLVVDKL